MFGLVTKMIRTNWQSDLFCAQISDLAAFQCLALNFRAQPDVPRLVRAPVSARACGAAGLRDWEHDGLRHPAGWSSTHACVYVL